MSDRPDFVNGFSKPSTMSTNEQGNPMEPSTTGLSPTSAPVASRSGRSGTSAPRPISVRAHQAPAVPDRAADVQGDVLPSIEVGRELGR